MLECKNATHDNIAAMLHDKHLSMRAKGLLTLLSQDFDNPTLETLRSATSDGLTAIRSAISEAENGGYLIRERMRDENGRMTQYRWIVDFKRYQ